MGTEVFEVADNQRGLINHCFGVIKERSICDRFPGQRGHALQLRVNGRMMDWPNRVLVKLGSDIYGA